MCGGLQCLQPVGSAAFPHGSAVLCYQCCDGQLLLRLKDELRCVRRGKVVAVPSSALLLAEMPTPARDNVSWCADDTAQRKFERSLRGTR